MEGETESDALDRIVKEALNLYKINGAGGAPSVWALARDAPIFIMSLCEGKDLTQIHYSKNFSEKKLSQIFLSIGISLSELHAAGCVHNDIKRNNVVIGKNPDKTFKAQIIDLGISTMGGCKPLMLCDEAAAPELDFDRQPLPESDVYSFGLMMFKMLLVRPLTISMLIPSESPVSTSRRSNCCSPTRTST